MITISDLEKYDPSKIHNVYDKWPQQAREAYKSDIDTVDFRNINHIVFAGMGGSGTIGDLFYSILSKTSIHISTVKGYDLPNDANHDTLVVTTSVSGNTDETIQILNLAFKRGCKTASFSSGGKIEEFCIKHNIHHGKINQIHSPRTSFAVFLFSMLNSLKQLIPIDESDIQESFGELDSLAATIRSSNLTESNPSLGLAEWLSGIPLLYYPWGFRAAVIRFKNSLQENAKTHCFAENIIETCHNGVVAWERTSLVKPILVRGQDDPIKTKERWEILTEFFKENQIEYREIISVKGGILSKLACLVYLLDYASIYYAIKLKIDPTPVKSIDYFKQRL